MFLGIFPTIPPAHTPPPLWPAQDFGRKLSSTMEVPWNTSFPSPALPGEIKTLQGMVLRESPALSRPGTAHLFPQKWGCLVEGGSYGWIPCPPSLATPQRQRPTFREKGSEGPSGDRAVMTPSHRRSPGLRLSLQSQGRPHLMLRPPLRVVVITAPFLPPRW